MKADADVLGVAVIQSSVTAAQPLPSRCQQNAACVRLLVSDMQRLAPEQVQGNKNLVTCALDRARRFDDVASAGQCANSFVNGATLVIAAGSCGTWRPS